MMDGDTRCKPPPTGNRNKLTVHSSSELPTLLDTPLISETGLEPCDTPLHSPTDIRNDLSLSVEIPHLHHGSNESSSDLSKSTSSDLNSRSIELDYSPVDISLVTNDISDTSSCYLRESYIFDGVLQQTNLESSRENSISVTHDAGEISIRV